MHDDQVDLDDDAAAALVHALLPDRAAQPVRRLEGSGTVNAIFRVGDDLAARFPLRLEDADEAAAVLRAEAAAMTELAEHCPVPSPLPVALGQPGPGYPMPWAVQTWLPGEVATPDGVADSLPFAHELVALLRALRAAPVRGRIFDGRGRGGDLAEHDAWVRHCLAQSAGLLDVERLDALWDRLRALPPSGPDVMSHRDLTPPNLLVADGRLVGVLDTGSFGPADPALDLVAAWHLLDARGRAVVRDEVGVGPVEWERGAAWALQQALGLVWYYVESNPSMSELGRSTITRLLDDLG